METARFPHQAMRCPARTLGGKRLLQAADLGRVILLLVWTGDLGPTKGKTRNRQDY